MSTSKSEQSAKKSQDKGGKVDKYLTDIKELPPTSKDDPKAENDASQKEEMTKQQDQKEVVEKNTHVDKEKKEPAPKSSGKESTGTEKEQPKTQKPAEKSSSVFTFKDIILGIINIISIVLIIILLTKLPQEGAKFQAERIEQIRNQINPQSEFANISDDGDKAAKLDALFLDDTGVVQFVSDVEKLKSENGSISKVTFASPKKVQDELGIWGIPVTIELRGNWDTIGPALEKIQTLPYLFRPINFEVGPTLDDPGVLVLNYGVFLYVSGDSSSK